MVAAVWPKDKEILEIGICLKIEQNVCLLERVISIKCLGENSKHFVLIYDGHKWYRNAFGLLTTDYHIFYFFSGKSNVERDMYYINLQLQSACFCFPGSKGKQMKNQKT